MEQEQLGSVIESLLLAHGEPIQAGKLMKITKTSEEEIYKAIEALKSEYLKHKRGFAILQKEQKIQLVTSSEYAQYVRQLIKRESSDTLSPAASEVLSVIAYRGPITRSEIEAIRGVNCSYVIRNLLVRGLVEKKEDESNVRQFLYSVSFEMLKALGINRLTDLPEYGSLSQDPRLESVREQETQTEN